MLAWRPNWQTTPVSEVRERPLRTHACRPCDAAGMHETRYEPSAPRLPPTLAVLAVAWLVGMLLGAALSEPLGQRQPAAWPLGGAWSGPLVGPALPWQAAAIMALAFASATTLFAWQRAALASAPDLRTPDRRRGDEAALTGTPSGRTVRGLAVVAALWCLAGGLRYGAAIPRIDSGHVAAYHGTMVELVGRVAAEPDRRDGRVGYRLAVREVRTDSGPALAHGLVIVWGPVHPVQPYGAVLRVRGRLDTPRAIEGFDYAGFLARQGIHSVMERATIERIARGGGNPLVRTLLHLKARGRMVLAASLPQPESGLATGILLGDDKGIPSHTADAFRRTNTSHVIAISGSNISLLVAALSTLLAPRLSARRSLPIILATLTLYALLVGADPAVVRAAIMGGLMGVAQALGRTADALIGLLAAAWAMTLYRPLYIGDLGFQLSFAATLGLIVLVPRLNYLGATWTRRIFLPRQQFPADRSPLSAHRAAVVGPSAVTIGTDQRRHALPIAQWLGEAVSTSVAAQLTTWPILAHQLGQISVAGLLANFLIVPVQPLVMGLGACTILAGLAVPALGAVVGALAWLPLAFTIHIVERAAGLPLAAVPWRMPATAMVLYYTGLALALLLPECKGTRQSPRPQSATPDHREATDDAAVQSRRAGQPPRGTPPREHCLGPEIAVRLRAQANRQANALLAGLAGVAILVWLAVFHQPDGLLHIRMLNVGQGDAVLVVAPNGRRMLVDGGPSPSAVLDRLGRYLAPWDRRLDAVVLTHPDADHVGGLPAVIERYRVALVLDSIASADTPNARQWQEALARADCRPIIATAGMRMRLDDRRGVWADVLWPPSGLLPANEEDPNALSTVLRLEYGRTAILLTGDLEAEGEAALLAAGAALRADVLKVGHHGSASSTGAPFVAAVQPRLALIGVGAGNRFGHPSPEVLARLASVPVLRTDQNGDIEILSDGREIWLVTGRRGSVEGPTPGQ